MAIQIRAWNCNPDGMECIFISLKVYDRDLLNFCNV